jgi:ribonuclease PH
MGSVLYRAGNTAVICAASVSEDVPDFANMKGTGWITAEYSMLPYSTEPRKNRPLARRDGRSVEIQRLIGRSLRCVADLEKLEGFSVTVDCDVFQADGGTRTASITGGYIALKRALSRLQGEGRIPHDVLTGQVAAVSLGYLEGELLLDLEYSEDSRADVDLNVVMDDSGRFIELQGTGEMRSFTREELDDMLNLAESGIQELMDIQGHYC